jgi:lipid-binding SYLF domain-containing protein
MTLPRRTLAVLTAVAALPLGARAARAATRREIDDEAQPALLRLREGAGTRDLAENAKAILIFPRILRGGFVFGGQFGNGALFHGAAPVAPPGAAEGTPAPAPWSIVGYYNIAGASFGLQIGAQSFGLAMFFMTDAALAFFERSQGWEIGTGPSVVALDAGTAASLTTSTMTQDVYSVTFGQVGLMAALGLVGSKISRIRPE